MVPANRRKSSFEMGEAAAMLLPDRKGKFAMETRYPPTVALFFDTETTGLPVDHLPPHSAAQPKLVQLAFILAEIGGPERASCNLMIAPEGIVRW